MEMGMGGVLSWDKGLALLGLLLLCTLPCAPPELLCFLPSSLPVSLGYGEEFHLQGIPSAVDPPVWLMQVRFLVGFSCGGFFLVGLLLDVLFSVCSYSYYYFADSCSGLVSGRVSSDFYGLG